MSAAADTSPDTAIHALLGRWQVHAIAGRAATRTQCSELGVETDVFDLFAVPPPTVKPCVVGVDVAAGAAGSAPKAMMYIVADGRSEEIGLRTRGECRKPPSYRLLPLCASQPDTVSWHSQLGVLARW